MSEKIYLEKDSGEKIYLTGTQYILGRDNSCDIVFREGNVSRKHARLRLRDGSWYIKDLHSTNGTKINGNTIEPDREVFVCLGDVIDLANRSRVVLKCEIAEDQLDSERKINGIKNVDSAVEKQNQQNERPDEKTIESIILSFLPVLDSIEYGIHAYKEGSNNPHLKGLQKIREQAMEWLKRFDVLPVDAVGKPFDPNLYNAVSHVSDPSLPANTVKEVVQAGYTYKGKILRYADVVVAN